MSIMVSNDILSIVLSYVCADFENLVSFFVEHNLDFGRRVIVNNMCVGRIYNIFPNVMFRGVKVMCVEEEIINTFVSRVLFDPLCGHLKCRCVNLEMMSRLFPNVTHLELHNIRVRYESSKNLMFANLRIVVLCNCAVNSDWSQFVLCSGLEVVEFRECCIDSANLEMLCGCVNLVTVRFVKCMYARELHHMNMPSQIKRLKIVGSRDTTYYFWDSIPRMSMIRYCDKLKSLELKDVSDIIDMGEVVECRGLRKLKVVNCWRVVNIGAMEKMKGLKFFRL